MFSLLIRSALMAWLCNIGLEMEKNANSRFPAIRLAPVATELAAIPIVPTLEKVPFIS